LNVRQSSLTYVSGLTKAISQNSGSYITNQDKKGLEKAFETLNAKLDITCAVLYDYPGNILAQFERGTQCRGISHPLPKGESHHFGLTYMDVTQEIKRGQDSLGTIHVKAHLEGYYSKVMSYATTLIVIMGCSFLFGYILFSNLQNTVTRHISDLASLMKIVSVEKNYSVRTQTITKDEIGVLAEGFNEMLHNIEIRDIELAHYRQGLEDLADQRTKELIITNEQLQKELAERIKIEKALQESEYRYRTIFETTGNANALVEKDFTISKVNGAFEKLSGFNRYEIENKKTLLEFAEKNDLDRIKSYLLARKEHSDSVPGELECRLINCQGFPRDVYASVSLIPGTTKSIASFIDVTDLRKLQGQLLHSQKMEAMGQLAGGIAHDFNNILTIIMGYGNILMMNTDKDSTIRSYVESILTSAERATNLTQSLLAFSRKHSISPKNIELNSVIKNVEKLLRHLIGEDIELQTQLQKTMMPVFADPGQIEQVLINLAVNARDAMPQGGSLIINTEILNDDQEFIKKYSNYKPGKYALISVADTGIGMNQEIVEHIFEPFFTTKEEGKGTGLGLSIVHGVITQHSGHIEVHSEPGQGTVFQMYLPIVAYQKEETLTPFVPQSSGGSETVLVAEDNEPVRLLVKNILAEYGYSVIESTNGEDAVEKFKNCDSSVHLLLLDIILPKIDGKSVYEEIRKIKPDIKALFMSGYAADIIQQHGISGNEYNFVQKPVLPHILLSKVRDVLNAR